MNLDHSAKIEPSLESWYAYLEEFTHGLGVNPPQVTASYDIWGEIELAELAQGDYKLVAEDTVDPKFRFSMLCLNDRGTAFSVGSKQELDPIVRHFDTHALRYRVEDQSLMRFAVRVEGFVPVDFRFEIHPHEPRLRIRVRNFDRLGTSYYSVDPKDVNRPLMAEFGKRVLRMSSRFDEMAGFTVDGEVRAALQARIAARKARRQKAGDEGRTGAQDPGWSKAGHQPLPSVSNRAAAPGRLPAGSLAKSPLPATDAPVEERGSGPEYAWVLTGSASANDINVPVGRIGPPGALKRFRLNDVLGNGRRFRMRDTTGNVRYSGFLTGKFRGVEPLVDVGYHHGCSSIEFEQQGAWVSPDSLTK